MANCSLKIFGVGAGTACGDRNHSAYLYRFAGAQLLVDCGEPVSRSYKATGLEYDTIDRIYLSHLHSDHVGGLFMLLQGFWLEKRRKRLVVHLPADGIEPVRQMLRAAYLFEELLSFELVFEPWRAGEPVGVGEVEATPFRTTHLEGFRKNFQGKYPGNYDAFCFLLSDGRVRVGHSADVGAVEDLDPLLTAPLDLLICELAHFRAEALFEYLQGRAIGHLVLVHLDRRYWENLEETRRLAGELLPGQRVTFARDQEEIGF